MHVFCRQIQLKWPKMGVKLSFSKFPGLFTMQGKLNVRLVILGWPVKLKKKSLTGLNKRINF